MLKHNTSSALQLGTNFSQKREKYTERMKTQTGLSNAWVPRFIVYFFFFSLSATKNWEFAAIQKRWPDLRFTHTYDQTAVLEKIKKVNERPEKL